MSTQSVLTGSDLNELMQAVLPDEVILRLVEAAQFQERERKRDAVALVRALVIAAATGYGGRQRDVARVYFENGAPKVARGGFYAWFGPELEATLAALSERALSYARAQPFCLPPLMKRFARDWHIVDSTTLKLHKALLPEYPGTGKYAALKVHKRLSVGTGTVYSYHISPAREHDAPHLIVDESFRGLGLLVEHGLMRDLMSFITPMQSIQSIPRRYQALPTIISCRTDVWSFPLSQLGIPCPRLLMWRLYRTMAKQAESVSWRPSIRLRWLRCKAA